jgi:hypothetical protein
VRRDAARVARPQSASSRRAACFFSRLIRARDFGAARSVGAGSAAIGASAGSIISVTLRESKTAPPPATARHAIAKPYVPFTPTSPGNQKAASAVPSAAPSVLTA